MRAAFDEPSKRPKKARKLSFDDSDTSNDSSPNTSLMSKQRKDTPIKTSLLPLPKCSYISKERCGGGTTKASQSQVDSKRAFSSDYKQTLDSTPKRINDSNKRQYLSTMKSPSILSNSTRRAKPTDHYQEPHDECHLSDMQDSPGSSQFNVIKNQPSTRNHNNCCDECRDYIRKELKRLSRQMYAIEALLKEENGVRGRGNEIVAEDLLPPLPLMTLQQFYQCENQLKIDTDMRKQFEHMICRIGGSTGKQFIKNTLPQIICNELGTQISWIGQKSAVGFKSTSISKLIIDSVMKRLPGSTSAELEIAIQEWLRRSGDRIRSARDYKQ
ncbi:PREDICTED: uncharacterized protein LOC105462610 isoform X2 [Wasmannia auropunctata]|uniref:uncharacterized protein LOC105462610 isoform X2 n=1 Tax=Wasmannia auropunctata TaxID=64793 RepID=UPI0005F058FB|nr:PREDICTED: uncharacterized protein LOC105462610 isoform X2 [Wasmannia auropunctata]